MRVAELISEDTWHRLQQSWSLGIRLGEETLTDLLLLDLARDAPWGLQLSQTTKSQEAHRGTDLEILVSTKSGGFVGFAIQAKKLYPTKYTDDGGIYKNLNSKVGNTDLRQIDVLERYSQRVGAIPFYLLYNFVDEYGLAKRSWHCCKKFQIEQLGCTLVPSWRVRQAINERGGRYFNWLHEDGNALPWRCLFNCPKQKWRRIIDFVSESINREQRREKTWEGLKKYDWIRLEPTSENESFNWLWDRMQRKYTDVEFDRVAGTMSSWFWNRDFAVLTEDEITEFYQRRGIERDNLMEPDTSDQNGQQEPKKKIDLVPRRFILVKSDEY